MSTRNGTENAEQHFPDSFISMFYQKDVKLPFCRKNRGHHLKPEFSKNMNFWVR